MFEVAELGNCITQDEYDKELPLLREQLLEAQTRIAEVGIPVIILFAGVDGAGKGDLSNLLSWWMDPRRIVTCAYERPTTEESERPEYWRFWRDLPAAGTTGVFLKGWYSKPLLQRAYGRITDAEFFNQLDQVVAFEESLVNNGALVLKFWMHLGRDQQEQRLRALEQDPLTAWRVRPKDWEHWGMYGEFVRTAEHLIARTSVGKAPWRIVEGSDPLYRSLEVGKRIVARINRALEDHETRVAAGKSVDKEPPPEPARGPTVLSVLDLKKEIDRDAYDIRLSELQGRLNELHRMARAERLSTVLVFEGMDAAGKGGAIRRLTAALDARSCHVVSIGAPTDEERAHHYLWRFWRLLPRGGGVVIFDRSWYGRVLVERVEGFASTKEWQRAYREINNFEEHLVDRYAVVGKFWLQVSEKEQAKRFEERANVPHKRWKLTDEDWRNRKQRPAYERAVHDMVARTSTPSAPWVLIEADDKRYARIRVLEEVCSKLESALHGPAADFDSSDLPVPFPREMNDGADV